MGLGASSVAQHQSKADPRGTGASATPASKTPAPWIGAAIRAGLPYAHHRKHPLVHNAINLGITAALLIAVGLIIAASEWAMIPNWAYIFLASIGFGWLYFAFFILVVHEASHQMYVLVPSNRSLQRSINRTAGWIFAGVFATDYGKHWERGHIEHHVRPMEPNDPQRNVLTGQALLRRILGYLFVPGFLFLDRTVLRAKQQSGKSSGSARVIIGFVTFWVIALTLAATLGSWRLALSLYLGMPVLAVFNLIKGSLEHGGSIAEEQSPFLRSRTSLSPLRHLFLPFNISLHFEHHLNFQVPWYDLARYQRDLREVVPHEVQRDVFNRRLLPQLSGRLGGVSEEARQVREPLQA